MNLLVFAEKYRLHVRRNPCDDSFIPGRFGSISEYGGDFLVLTFLADGDDKSRDNILRSRIRRALAAGLQPSQIGDFEAVLLFDGNDKVQIRAAMKLAGIKRRRRQTGKGKPLTSERARELAQIRLSNAREGRETPQSRGISPQVEEMPEPVLVGDVRPSARP